MKTKKTYWIRPLVLVVSGALFFLAVRLTLTLCLGPGAAYAAFNNPTKQK